MTAYRDTEVDPYTGTRMIDATAFAILDTLTSMGGAVPVTTIDDAIIRNGGSLNLKPWAVKGLRNMGAMIEVDVARHNTTYSLGITGTDNDGTRERDMKAWYSICLSQARSFAGALALNPNDQDLADALRDVQFEAIRVGTSTQVGLTLHEVIAELDPL